MKKYCVLIMTSFGSLLCASSSQSPASPDPMILKTLKCLYEMIPLETWGKEPLVLSDPKKLYTLPYSNGGSLGKIIEQHNPELFPRRDAILKLIAPLGIAQGYFGGLDVDQDVARYVTNHLVSPHASAITLAQACCALRAHPVNLLEYQHDGVSLRELLYKSRSDDLKKIYADYELKKIKHNFIGELFNSTGYESLKPPADYCQQQSFHVFSAFVTEFKEFLLACHDLFPGGPTFLKIFGLVARESTSKNESTLEEKQRRMNSFFETHPSLFSNDEKFLLQDLTSRLDFFLKEERKQKTEKKRSAARQSSSSQGSTQKASLVRDESHTSSKKSSWFSWKVVGALAVVAGGTYAWSHYRAKNLSSQRGAR